MSPACIIIVILFRSSRSEVESRGRCHYSVRQRENCDSQSAKCHQEDVCLKALRIRSKFTMFSLLFWNVSLRLSLFLISRQLRKLAQVFLVLCFMLATCYWLFKYIVFDYLYSESVGSDENLQFLLQNMEKIWDGASWLSNYEVLAASLTIYYLGSIGCVVRAWLREYQYLRKERFLEWWNTQQNIEWGAPENVFVVKLYILACWCLWLRLYLQGDGAVPKVIEDLTINVHLKPFKNSIQGTPVTFYDQVRQVEAVSFFSDYIDITHSWRLFIPLRWMKELSDKTSRK
jgi:hypothetical protein